MTPVKEKSILGHYFKENCKATWRIVNELTSQKSKNPTVDSLIIDNKTETELQFVVYKFLVRLFCQW